ncbi:hypothetical protein OF83DRAFT_776287 [Amylostereum chailletii]|nr:hypothetical protein OF83DRAFT_776287 [Amylostereum chailletii]
MPSVEDDIIEILSKPFGPYLEQDALTDTCKSTQSHVLQLESVMLQYGNQPTGLDMTEHAKGQVPWNVRHLSPLPPRSPILFRGILTINKLAHLTEKAIKRLNTEIYVRLREKSHTRTKLTVESLYEGRGKPKSHTRRIRLLLQGEKSNLSVGYLTNKLVPNGLTFWSRDRQRQYEVASMDILTYEFSRTYLFRYHTLRALQTIYEANQDITVISNRTPEWFTRNYIDAFASAELNQWRRVLFDEDADDTDTGSFLGEPSQEAHGTSIGVLTHLPRELRVVHRTEFYSILAAHIEWILADQSARHRKWIDCDSWRTWAIAAAEARRRMSTSDSDRLWGAPDEYEASLWSEELDDGEAFPAPQQQPILVENDHHSDPEDWSPNKRRVYRTANHAGSSGDDELPIIKTSPSKKKRKVIVLSSDSEVPKINPRKRKAKPTYSLALPDPFDQNIYDSSSSSSSASESDRPSHHSGGVHPAIRQFCHLIPVEFCHRPVPPEDFIWDCPLSECAYSLDLLHLTENDKGLIPAEMAQDLNRPLDDERMVAAFRAVVEEHQRVHLRERGIVFESHRQTGGTPTMRWLHPRPELPTRSKKWEDEMARRFAQVRRT